MENEPYKILVVDDEKDITEFLGYNLRKEGFQVSIAHSGIEALRSAHEEKPQLILLDVMMPGMDGIEACEKLREDPLLKHTIIAFLTARSEDYSQIAGFEAGADDYITKPVRPKVLISRLRALLKRYNTKESKSGQPSSRLKLGPIEIDPERFLVIVSGRELTLPKKEFNLLCLLTSRPSMVFVRDEIYQHVWEGDQSVGQRTIDVYIRKLREKIGMDCIKTIKGVGYKFEIPDEQTGSEGEPGDSPSN